MGIRPPKTGSSRLLGHRYFQGAITVVLGFRELVNQCGIRRQLASKFSQYQKASAGFDLSVTRNNLDVIVLIGRSDLIEIDGQRIDFWRLGEIPIGGQQSGQQGERHR